MNKQETLQPLKAHKARLTEKFGVTDLALFGSTVRDTAGPDSDIDCLIAFNGPATSKRYCVPSRETLWFVPYSTHVQVVCDAFLIIDSMYFVFILFFIFIRVYSCSFVVKKIETSWPKK